MLQYFINGELFSFSEETSFLINDYFKTTYQDDKNVQISAFPDDIDEKTLVKKLKEDYNEDIAETGSRVCKLMEEFQGKIERYEKSKH